jgi:hypothetical protein
LVFRNIEYCPTTIEDYFEYIEEEDYDQEFDNEDSRKRVVRHLGLSKMRWELSEEQKYF